MCTGVCVWALKVRYDYKITTAAAVAEAVAVATTVSSQRDLG